MDLYFRNESPAQQMHAQHRYVCATPAPHYTNTKNSTIMYQIL